MNTVTTLIASQGSYSRPLPGDQLPSQQREADPASAAEQAPASVVTLSLVARTAAAPAGKSFAAVASDARASLDQTLGTGGDIHTTADQWRSAFAGMDRRSLYAVASNQGGQFSQVERDAAHWLMADQQSQAMGLNNQAAFSADPSVGYKAGVAFLDSVSDEEKASFEWAQQRAAVQYGYEAGMRQKGEEPEAIDSTSPLVKMLKGAMDALRALNDASKKLEDMPQYQQAMQYSARQQAGASGLVDKTA